MLSVPSIPNPLPQDLAAKIQVLLDERDIRDVLLRYCRGVDRCDRDLIASCYHPDAVDDHGTWFVNGPDVPQLVINAIQPGTAVAMHFVGNMHIEVQGDIAYTESYLLAFRSFDRDAQNYHRTRAARFVDKFTRREGVWRIQERVVVDDWDRVDEVTQRQEGHENFRRGTKDQNDAVYQIRRGPLARKAG
jgi:ketosteroid isomerase-like protein